MALAIGENGSLTGCVCRCADALDPMQARFSLPLDQKEGVVSVAMAGAAVGSFFGGALADVWGRRPSICACGVLFGLGSVTMAAR